MADWVGPGYDRYVGNITISDNTFAYQGDGSQCVHLVAREVNAICGDCSASSAIRSCFVDTSLEFRCIRRLSQQRFHNPAPRFPPRGPGGPVPAFHRYYQGATTCCRPSFPSLGATTRCALHFAPPVSKRNHGGPGVVCIRPPPEGRLNPLETAASPKFLGNLHCAYARFFDSGVTARSSP